VTLRAIVHNGRDEAQSTNVEMESPFTAAGTFRIIDVPAEGLEVAEFSLHVGRAPSGSAVFRVVARGASGEEDRIEVRILVAPRGAPTEEGRSGSLAASEARELVFKSPGAIPGSRSLVLEVDRSVASAILGAVEPLVSYPYGCVEQTMSRFLPAVSVKRALGVAPPRVAERLPQVIGRSLERLMSFQHRDGGWGWWEHDATNDALTAYVLFGLAECKRAGVGIDRAATERASAYLRERLRKQVLDEESVLTGHAPLPAAPDLAVYAAFALAVHEDAWGCPSLETERLVATLCARENLSPIDEVLLALAARLAGLEAESARLAARAKERPLDDVATAALLLRLQAARGEDGSAAARFLLARRRGALWRTTLESAYAVLGLAALCERGKTGEGSDDAFGGGHVTVSVNGERRAELVLPDHPDASFDGRLVVAEPSEGWGERVVVALQLDGARGATFYTATLRSLVADPAPVSRGISVRRSYYEERPEGWTPVERRVRPGSRLLVHLEIATPTSRDYVLLEDPRAPGFEPVDASPPKGVRGGAAPGLTDRVALPADLAARLRAPDAERDLAWSQALLAEILERSAFKPAERSEDAALPERLKPDSTEVRDDRTLFFFTTLPQGTSHVFYVVRAELPGSVTASPPRIAPMYEPEVAGSGVTQSFSVHGPGDELGSHGVPPLGVAGLAPVVSALAAVDADVLAAELASEPRIGALLGRFLDERALRVWLAADLWTRSAGPDLEGRIAAARRDLATRRLLLDALAVRGEPEWAPILEEAAGDDGLVKRALAGATPADPATIDEALLWAREDREWRSALVAAALKLRGTTRLGAWPRSPSIVRGVVAALGERAPTGEALVRWKLSQRFSEEATLARLAEIARRDLDLDVRLLEGALAPSDATSGSAQRFERALDALLEPRGLVYRVDPGRIVVGMLEELAR